ncbi:MAG: GNAT family N-acetyltransferase [Pseudomonadota bacterium]
MAEITVRLARAEDAQAMADILNPLIEEGTSTAITGTQVAADWVELAAGQEPRSLCHVAETGDGTVVGFQYVEPDKNRPEQACQIASFARIDGGGRGIGRALFAVTSKGAKVLGYEQIIAVIRADNVSGLGYYTKMQFRDDHVYKAVPMSDGKEIDRVQKVFTIS